MGLLDFSLWEGKGNRTSKGKGTDSGRGRERERDGGQEGKGRLTLSFCQPQINPVLSVVIGCTARSNDVSQKPGEKVGS